MGAVKLVNLADLAWRTRSRSERITVDFKDPARHLGSTVAGFVVERVQPGKQASPVHRHHLQEEIFLILAGTGVLRHGEQDIPVRPGDFILYLPADPAAHTFINNGTEPLQYLVTGNRTPYEVCEYPDDGTVYVEALGKTLRNDAVQSIHTASETQQMGP